MALQWILVHCEITQNEKAETLAKIHGEGGQPQDYISYEEKVMVIKRLMMCRQRI